MRDKIFNFTIRHPIWVILVIITVAMLAASGAQKLVFKADYRIFFPEDNPQLVAYESIQKIYNRSDNVTLVVVPKDGNVFSAGHLAALKELTKQSWQIPYSTRVDSLTNFQYTYAEQDDLIVEDLVLEPLTLTEEQLARIKQVAINEPQLVDKIVSHQGHVSTVEVAVKLPGIDATAEVPEVALFVNQLREQFMAQNPGSQVYLSGMVMLNNAFTEASMKDGSTLVPLMFATVILIIGLLLRTISGTISTVQIGRAHV